MRELRIDVWCGGEYNPIAECLDTIGQGKAVMRKAKAEGKTDLRMHVLDADDESYKRTYYFDGNRIKMLDIGGY